MIHTEILTAVVAAFLLILFFLILSFFWYCRKRKKKCIETDATTKETEISSLRLQLNERQKEIERQEYHLEMMEVKLKKSTSDIIELAKRNDPSFLKRFQELYPEVVDSFLQKHPDITKSEHILCAMIFLHLSTKEIASYTSVEHRTVQTKKYRLKKKLKLQETADLEEYIFSFI